MYLCGRSGEIVYPDPLILNGHPLPWVKISVHLGHQLSQECTTNFDCRIKRAQFIEKSTAISLQIHQILSLRYPTHYE